MNRRSLWIALAALLVLAVAVTFLVWRRGAVEEQQETSAEEVSPVAEGSPAAASIVAELYFPDGGEWLHAERREVPASDRAEAQIATLVETLIAGPRSAGLVSPLPESVAVRTVYKLDGEVVLDLESPDAAPPPSGSQREMLTVYSLVNTVLLNTEDADRLVLLWNGQQPETFAGHLDTARPLSANRGLIARDPAAGSS
jgi:spore germination protein GerM